MSGIKTAFLIIFFLGMILVTIPMLKMILSRIRIYTHLRYGYRLSRVYRSGQASFSKTGFALLKNLNRHINLSGMGRPSYILIVSCIVIGSISFILFFQLMSSLFNNLILSFVFGSSPLLYVWHRNQMKKQHMALVMIPTVQTFIGFFTESGNLIQAIRESGDQMPFEIQGEWHRMVNDINTNEELEVALIRFAGRVGNEWAHDFVDILITHIDNGSNITPSLFKLVNEMQNMSFNEEKRITLLALYRWGTILLIILGVAIVYINIRLDPQTRIYYFVEPFGKNYITFSTIVLFSSFIFAMFMGRKKF